MHIVTKEGAELHGRRFAPGTVLDLPEHEAEALVDAGTADLLEPAAKPKAKSGK